MIRGLSTGSEQALRGTIGGVSYFGKGLVTGADAVVSGVLEPTEEATRFLHDLWPGRESQASDPEVCSTHSIYQQALWSRFGARSRRGRAKREITLCSTTSSAAPS